MDTFLSFLLRNSNTACLFVVLPSRVLRPGWGCERWIEAFITDGRQCLWPADFCAVRQPSLKRWCVEHRRLVFTPTSFLLCGRKPFLLAGLQSDRLLSLTGRNLKKSEEGLCDGDRQRKFHHSLRWVPIFVFSFARTFFLNSSAPFSEMCH